MAKSDETKEPAIQTSAEVKVEKADPDGNIIIAQQAAKDFADRELTTEEIKALAEAIKKEAGTKAEEALEK